MDSNSYQRFEADIASGAARWTRNTTIDYLSNITYSPAYGKMQALKPISMLAVEALLICRGFALASRTGILQIGTYVGGSTIALASGAKDGNGSRIVSIERGGAVPDQPYIPTNDIIADCRKNMEAHGVADQVELIGGFAEDPATIERVRELAQGRKFDVFFMDSDGEIARNIRNYSQFLTDDCLLIFDDYYNVIGSLDKAEKCLREIHALMLEGVFEQYALSPFSTWTGRMDQTKKRAPTWFAKLMGR